MGHGIEMEVCKGTGSGGGVRKTQEKMACDVWGGVQKGVQVGAEPRWGLGWPEWVHMYAQSWNDGNRVWWVPSTPPIGKLEPLGLISGEMVLQDGWQGWTDMSKCGNVARFGTCMCAVNRIKWVLHLDMICNEAWPGRH